MAAQETRASAPLSGIRVLDFTHVLAGPFCTRVLADLGADVVRVESSRHPDHPWPSAYISPDGRHASYLNTNRSKRSIALDLKNDAGRETAARLATKADVIVENFSAGVMERLTLDYKTLQITNPALIYVSMSGYGHNGPRRDWTSMNMNLQGYSGLMMVTGGESDPPIAISNSWNDYIGGLHAAFAILQAVEARMTSGKGARIDLSQFECSAAMVGPLLIASAVNGTAPLRRGNRSAVAAPQGVYRCAGNDEWCAISIENDDQWLSLTRAMEKERWGSESRFQSAAGRLEHQDEIDTCIERWTETLGSREVEIRLKTAGVDARRVRRIDEVIDAEDPATVFAQMEERRTGTMRTTRLPFSFASANLPPAKSAARLGENSSEVLREWLNLSADEIETLAQKEALR